MMGVMREWLLGVVCTAMVLALAEALAPEGGAKRACRLAGGLALLLAAAGPLLKLDGDAFSRALERYSVSVEESAAALAGQNSGLYKTIIEEDAAAYILDKAEEMGILCQVEVTFGYEEDGTPCLREVTARGEWTQGQKERLSRMLEEDLGVPVQRQYYEEIQP